VRYKKHPAPPPEPHTQEKNKTNTETSAVLAHHFPVLFASPANVTFHVTNSLPAWVSHSMKAYAITPAIDSCSCLFDRCLPSFAKLFSSVILRSFRQMEERPSQTQRTGCRHQESQTQGPGPGLLLFHWAKVACSYRRSLILKMPPAGNKSLVLCCLINLLCPLLCPSGDETPAVRPLRDLSSPTQGREHLRPTSLGHFSASCVKAIKASKHQIRHLKASEEWRGFPPPWLVSPAPATSHPWPHLRQEDSASQAH